MIKIVDIHKTFNDGEGENKILRGISLTINENEFITIMGPSGCGKSTLLNIISLLTEPTSGSVYFDNIQINFKKEKELEKLRRDKIGLIFQNANLISCLNPLENILLSMNSHDSNRVKKSTVLELLELVGIADKYKYNIKSLSGGEAQRVAIVRALVNRPQVLVCDEPTGALDMENGNNVIDLLMETRKKTKCSLIIVTHDKNIWKLGERKIEINGGKIFGVDEGI